MVPINITETPNKIVGWVNVQPFNAMSFIIIPINRIGSNSNPLLNNSGCPSIGHIAHIKERYT